MLEYESERFYIAIATVLLLQQKRSVIPVGSINLGRYMGGRVATVLEKWFGSNRNTEIIPV